MPKTEIITKQQKKLIENEVLAFATSNLENRPNVVAVACVKVVGPNQILITDNFMNKTRKNLEKNNKVAVAVWSKDWEEGYHFKGTAEYIAEGRWKGVVEEMKENEGLAHKAAVLVTVEEIYDLANPAKIYPPVSKF